VFAPGFYVGWIIKEVKRAVLVSFEPKGRDKHRRPVWRLNIDDRPPFHHSMNLAAQTQWVMKMLNNVGHQYGIKEFIWVRERLGIKITPLVIHKSWDLVLSKDVDTIDLYFRPKAFQSDTIRTLSTTQFQDFSAVF